MKTDGPGQKGGSGQNDLPADGVSKSKKTGKNATKSSVAFSSEHCRALIENINDGVYHMDLHGNFTYVNNSLCRIFGYPREEIQSQRFSQFMEEERAQAAYEVFRNVFRTGEGVADLIWKISDKSGKTRILELSVNPVINKEGVKEGFQGIARDVTERLRAQETLRESELHYQCQYEASFRGEKRYRTLLDFVPYPMVVFTYDGRVTYLNPAFTETFGWTLKELEGSRIPYVPPELQREAGENIKKLFREKVISRHETKRLTKDGRTLDVVMRGAVYSENEEEDGGELVILRDITREKRMGRINDALLRISLALPEHPDLEELLDYISSEVKKLLNVEGAIVILLDEERKELYFLGAAYDDTVTQKRAKEIRYPAEKGVSGRVIKTGEPLIVHDTSTDPHYYSMVDEQLGYHTRSMLDVPLRSSDRIIGVLCAINKKKGVFDQEDIELLSMIAGTVALSIENARFSKQLREAYKEVTSLNRAKDKVINHLSHELKTPVSVLLASLNVLRKKLADFPGESWKLTLERAQRNLDRILDLQYQVEDIMRDRQYTTYHTLSLLLDECTDELEALLAEEVGEHTAIERIRQRIGDMFGPKEIKISEINLDGYVQERLAVLQPQFSHRRLEIMTDLQPVPSICIPSDVLQKVVDGLIKNAIENTPDGGRVEVAVKKGGEGTELVVHDYGVGITEEGQRRIFEGFFSTQDTMAYSSKRPFDFNAGGSGADLLRMKIFAERYNFRIDMVSSRCGYIPKDGDICPGRISRCSFCKKKRDCHLSGGTAFTVFFPPAPVEGCSKEDEP